jgi:hypothetical protein
LSNCCHWIAAYQRFYEIKEVDDDRNRAFFTRFIAPSDDGLLLGAWRGDDLLGYACLYWHFTSLVPAETVLMNDLYVATAPDNAKAQRLYDATGAQRSTWIEYELGL